MHEANPYDSRFHKDGSAAAEGCCSQHGRNSRARGTCTGKPVISFQDRHNRWQSGCSVAQQQLADRGEITPPDQ